MRLALYTSCLFTVLGLTSGVSATVIFSDGFEGNDVGTRPPANWSLTHAAMNGTVVSDPVRTGARAMQIIDDNSSAMGILTTAFESQTEGQLKLTFYIRPTATDQQMEVALMDATGDALFANILLLDTGRVGYTSRGNWVNSSEVSYIADAWNKVVATADLDAKAWDLTVNDQVVATGIAAGRPGGGGDWTTNVGRIKFAGAAAATPTFYFDDVELAIVPEPAAMTILAGAGLMLLGRRRR